MPVSFILLLTIRLPFPENIVLPSLACGAFPQEFGSICNKTPGRLCPISGHGNVWVLAA